MENKRYNFGGYTFGNQGLFVLMVEVLNHTETGTSYSTEIRLELSPEERQELITTLMLASIKENN